MGLFSNSPKYARGVPSNANFNAGVNAGWIDLRGVDSIGFHIVCDAVSGLFVFETTDEEDPRKGTLTLPASAIVLPAALATLATPAGPTAVNYVFSFGYESTNKAAFPEAAWMKCRYASTSGGSATGLNIGVCRRGP